MKYTCTHLLDSKCSLLKSMKEVKTGIINFRSGPRPMASHQLYIYIDDTQNRQWVDLPHKRRLKYLKNKKNEENL